MIQEEAIKQVKEGAHILDVNVGVSGIDEPLVLEGSYSCVREVTQVPLCIDSALPEGYRGRPCGLSKAKPWSTLSMERREN